MRKTVKIYAINNYFFKYIDILDEYKKNKKKINIKIF